jgi:hypothetical protein
VEHILDAADRALAREVGERTFRSLVEEGATADPD